MLVGWATIREWSKRVELVACSISTSPERIHICACELQNPNCNFGDSTYASNELMLAFKAGNTHIKMNGKNSS